MLLYNNHFLPQQDLKLPITNRAFQYNDGFFETIMVVDGRLRYWVEHRLRIKEAADTMQLVLPDYFWDGELEENLLQLAKQRNAVKLGRLKLKVWRAGAGLYTPQTNAIEWLATVEPVLPVPDTGMHVGVSVTVRTVFSPLSHFKGPHAPLYVLAGIEKQTRNLDDVLLLDPQGYVAELISSNIFWISEGNFVTPALKTGCVNGIMRRNIIRWCRQQGVEVQELMAKQENLLQADCVFAANVTGIRQLTSLDSQKLGLKDEMLLWLKENLLL